MEWRQLQFVSVFVYVCFLLFAFLSPQIYLPIISSKKPEKIHSELLEVKPSSLLFTGISNANALQTFDVDNRIESPNQNLISWSIQIGNGMKYRFDARLSPDPFSEFFNSILDKLPLLGTFTAPDIGTWVWVEYPKIEMSGAVVNSSQPHDAASAALIRFYVVAMREHIAAVLENRPFSIVKTYPAMFCAMVMNFTKITDDIDKISVEYSKEAKKNIEKAYREEAEKEGTTPPY